MNYLIGFLTMLVLDSIYLFLVGDFFGKIIQKVQKSKLKMRKLPLLGIYTLVWTGLYYFILKRNSPPLDAFLLGVVIYGIFDLTNIAIFKDWTYTAAIIDSLWGGLLFYLTTFITYSFKS